MRISKSNKGFTLIEMMVVLVIIGIIVSSIVLSIKTDDLSEHMEIEINRMRALIMLAREEAILQDHDMALAIKEDSYKFQWYDIKTQKWLPMDDGQVFRERKLVPGTELVLVIADLPVKDKPDRPGLSTDKKDEADAKQKQEDEDENLQRVVIFPSGDIFPFELILRKQDETVQFKLMTDQAGEIDIEFPEDKG